MQACYRLLTSEDKETQSHAKGKENGRARS